MNLLPPRTQPIEHTQHLQLWILLGIVFFGSTVCALTLFNPFVVMVILAGMTTLVIIVKYNLWLVFYIASFMIQIFPLASLLGANVHPSHIFLIGMIGQQVISELIRQRWRVRSLHWLDLGVLCYVLMMIVSLLWTPVSLITAVILIIRVIFINVLAYLAITREVMLDWHRAIVRIVIGFVLFVFYLISTAAYNLWQIGIWSLFTELRTSALSGSNGLGILDSTVMASITTMGRNVLTGWLVVGLFLLWGVRQESEAMRLSRSTHKLLTTTAFLAFAFVVIALSRSSWISLTAGIFAWAFCSGFHFSLRQIVSIIVSLIVLIVGTHILGFDQIIIARLAALGNEEDMGLTRIGVWTKIWEVFLQHPIGGTGIAGLAKVISSVIEGLENPHSIYFYFLGEYGLMGIAVITFIITSSLLNVWRAARCPVEGNGRVWYGVFAALVALLVQGLFQYAFSEVIIWIVLGLSSGTIAVKQNSQRAKVMKPLISRASYAE